MTWLPWTFLQGLMSKALMLWHPLVNLVNCSGIATHVGTDAFLFCMETFGTCVLSIQRLLPRSLQQTEEHCATCFTHAGLRPVCSVRCSYWLKMNSGRKLCINTRIAKKNIGTAKMSGGTSHSVTVVDWTAMRGVWPGWRRATPPRAAASVVRSVRARGGRGPGGGALARLTDIGRACCVKEVKSWVKPARSGR